MDSYIKNENFSASDIAGNGEGGEHPLKIVSPRYMETLESVRTVTGTAEPGANIKLRVSDNKIVTAKADKNGTWLAEVPPFIYRGVYSIFAISDTNHSQSACVSFVINKNAAKKVITEPSSQYQNMKTVIVSDYEQINQIPSLSACEDTEKTLELKKPIITYPAEHEIITDCFPKIHGIAEPDCDICVSVKNVMSAKVKSDNYGNFYVQFQRPLPSGTVIVTAALLIDGAPCGENCECVFSIKTPEIQALLNPPAVLSPENNCVLSGASLYFTGIAEPGNSVSVCIKSHACSTAVASHDGSFSIFYPGEFKDGKYTANISQRDPNGNSSLAEKVKFTVKNENTETNLEIIPEKETEKPKTPPKKSEPKKKTETDNKVSKPKTEKASKPKQTEATNRKTEAVEKKPPAQKKSTKKQTETPAEDDIINQFMNDKELPNITKEFSSNKNNI